MPTKSVNRLFAIAVVSMLAQMAWASDSLSFFNNWFVTGDYAVAGVGLRGSAGKGNISMSGVPSGGQPIAAFLYWSTVETSSTPGAAVGLFNGNKIQGAVLGNPASPNAACGPAPTGSAGFVYRADVLRYLPVDANNIPKANGAQAVQLPATPVGTVLYTDGATLVVIYKIVAPGDPDEAPLRSVVIYNGAFTMTKGSAGMTQNVAGFYQASSNPAAKITGIVANGQHGFSSPWSVNGKNLSTNPFTGGLGADWDNPTYNISLAANASAFSTLATVSNNQTCLTWAAIVASVNVQDTDLDGLLDVWETRGLHRNTAVSPATFGACSDYPAEPCVNLPAMGANPKKQDIFIQIDWMHGAGGANGTHDHIPQLTALNSVAATFALHGISVHYDVGSYYQGPQSVCGNALCSFIIPATYAQGGHDDDESHFVCNEPPGSKHPCNYTGPVLSFEYGFASIRDGNSLLGIPAHFAQNRRDVFHYGLFAHALAGPFDVNGHPANPFTGEPAPLPATPLSYSGIAHRPGGGFMVTFGLWGSDTPAYDQVGSPQQQAGTLMHELGHNLGLGHAGLSTKPNCMPNYPSVMNYKYQTHLKDASGNIQVDYSYGLLLPMSEDFLNAAIPMGFQHYRVRYFGPLAPGQSATQAAAAHCDGSPLKSGDAPEVSLEGAAISTPDWSNGTVAIGKFLPPLDVNYDGIKGQLFLDQPDWFTLNLQQIGTGYSFGGLSVGAFATDGGVFATDGGAFATDAGALATDGGVFATDGGAFATDAGAFATDGGVFATDGGVFATDGGAFATDAGELDENTELCSGPQAPTQLAANLGTNAGTGNSIVLTWTPPQAGSNLTYNIYRCAGAGCTPTAPPFKNVSGGATPATPSFTDTVTDSMHAGTACPAGATCPNTTYVYAVTALATPSCGGVPTVIESLFSNTASSEVPELFVVPTATTVTYDGNPHTVTVQIFGDIAGALTPAQVTCGTERNAGTYQVSGNGVTNQITCSNPAPTPSTEGVVYVASGGTVPTYTDGGGVHTPGALTINQRPITVTAAANKKTYDSNTSAAALPTITTGTLGTGDKSNFSETYYDLPVGTGKNVGLGKTLVPSGIVNDSNNGNNYSVTFTNSANGEIDPAPLTASIGNPNVPTKQYNGNTAATLVSTNFSLSGLQGPDNFTVTQTAGTYSGPNVVNVPPTSVTASLAPSNFTPLGGTLATNYTLPTTASGPGAITPVPLTASIVGNPAVPAKQYNGSTAATLAPTNFSLSPLVGTDNFTVMQPAGTYSSPNAGTPTVTASLASGNFTALGTTIATNYTLPITASGPGQITAVPLTASIVNNPARPYNGTTIAPLIPANFSLSPLVGGDNFTVTQTVGTYGSANAGSTTVTASLASGNFTPLGTTIATNYTLPTGASGTGTITQAPPTVTATGATCTYNATPCAGNGSATGVLSETLAPAVTLSYSGTSNSSVAYGPSATAPTNAGNYTVTASFAGNINYFPGTSTPATITINQATPTVTDGGPSPATPAYGQPVTLTVTIAPPQSGEAPTGTVMFSFTLNSITNYICSPNGSISTTPCSVPVTFNGTNYIAAVTTSTLPTAAENVMATYSGDPNFLSEPANNVSVTVNQANSNITLTKSADPSTYGQGVNLTVEVTDATGGSIGVPTGTVTLSFKLNPSDPGGQVYYICADGSVVTTACVNPIALAPDPNNPVGATVTVPTSALPAGLASANPQYSYPINATYSGDTNFAHSGPFGLSQTVNPLAASVTPNAAGKVYGATDPTLTGTLSGFLPADNVSAAYSRVAGETVASSPYTISATLSPASVLNNYNIAYNTANFAISTAPLAIAASSGSVPYGSAVPGITAGYSGFVNGDSYSSLTTQPSCGTNYTQGSPYPGPYATFCGSAADSNYNISYAPGSLSVTQVNLQITASSPTITVGSPVPTITASYSGFVNGENYTALTTQPACSVSGYTPSSPAGNYPTSCTSAVDNNYNISYVSGTLTVNPAPVPLAITAGPVTGFQSYTYPATLLTASGGTAPYAWSWSGSPIAGMNLTAGGVLTGFPTGAGTANVTVTDANSNSVSAQFTIYPPTVVRGGAGDTQTISSVTLNSGPIQLTATPGTPITVNFTYNIVQAGGCPGCIDQLVVGFVNTTPTSCVYDGLPGPAGTGDQPGSVNLTAPSTPGRYYISFSLTENYSCQPVGNPSQGSAYTLASTDPAIAVVDVIPTASVTWQNVTVTNISVTPQVHVGDQITATFTLSPPSSGTIGLGFNTDPALDQCGGLNYTTVSPTFTAPSQPGRYYLSIDNPNTCGVSTTPWTSGIPGANFTRYIGAVDVLPPHP